MKYLCLHGHLHPSKYKTGKYIPTSLCRYLKSILEKYWYIRNSYELDTNGEHPTFLTNNNTTENNIKCNVCVKTLYRDIIDKTEYMKNPHKLVRRLNRVDYTTQFSTYGVCNKFLKNGLITFTLLLVNYRHQFTM